MRIVVTLAASPLLPPRLLPPLPPPTSAQPSPSTSARPSPSTSTSASTSASPSPFASSSLDGGAVCFAPFFYSGDGIKRYVLECLSAGGDSGDAMIPDCTVPYTFDSAGRHHYIAACMNAVDEPCAVPFSFDDDGTKHYKSACLSD